MKKFEFTTEELRQIFYAGQVHGENVQCAYDWGTTCQSSPNYELISVLQDILNRRNRENGMDDSWVDSTQVQIMFDIN